MPLYNGSNTAAGVYGGEEDNSFSASTSYPSTGVLVGEANRGPVGVPVECLSGTYFKNTFGVRDASLTYAHFCAERFLKAAQRLWFFRVDTGANYGSGSFRTVNNFCTAKVATKGYLDPVADHNQLPEEIMLVYAANPGKWNNNLRVLVYPDTNDIENEQFVLQVFETNFSNPVETYRGTLRDKITGQKKQLNIEYQLENAESRIRVKINENHALWKSTEGAGRSINAIATVDLSYGDNGGKATMGDIISGWEMFDNEDDYDARILINGGYADVGVHQAMTALAEKRRDCFAILDCPYEYRTATKAVEYRRNVQNINSSFSALYVNWIKEKTDDGTVVEVPPSGAIAAVYANSDAAKAVWFAPAGVERGIIADIEGISHKYTQNERNLLDENQINFIHKFSGYGFSVWSATTLQSEKSALQDIPVRRLVNHIETTAKYDVLVGLFDPNDEYLWAQLKSAVEAILRPIMNGRGLYFYQVKCDAELNTPDIVAGGDVILVYVIEPTRYSKRILFTATVAATGQISTALEYVTTNTNI